MRMASVPPSPSRAGYVAVGVSLGLHLAVLLGISGIAFFRFEPPIPIEILPMKPRPPAPPALDPPPPVPEKQTSPKVSHPGTTQKAAPKPPQKVAPATEDLHAVGPATANITILLRGPLLARSPHRDGVDSVLSMLPDYHTLLDGTGLHPFDDLEALLIATPDPRDVTATFLAARHKRDPRIARLTTRKLDGGDPRVFRALSDDVMLLGRPDDLARIAAAEESDGEAPSAETREAQRWLTALRHFDGGPKEAAMQLTVADLPQLIRFQGELPMPRSIRLALSADAAPFARLVCIFDDEDSAERFVAEWPGLKVKLAESIPVLAGAFDELVIVRREREVELAGRLKEAHVKLVLSFATLMGRRAPAPAQPPQPGAQVPDPE
jgi:hypothetical protein